MVKLCVMVVVAVALLRVPMSAQSFDCGRATTAVEKMICADRDLSKLDEEMARAYQGARARADAAAIGQPAWLRDVRNKCGTAACLKDTYESRIAFLQNLRPASFSTDGLAGEWTRVQTTRDESGGLTIENVTADGFAFDLFAMLQLADPETFRSGEIEGVAAIRGGVAVYTDEDSECRVTFTRNADRLIVAASECADKAGMGVGFEGEYRKK